MAHWLMKSEPASFSIDDLLALDYRYGEVEPWENPQIFKGPQDTGLHRLRVANS